MAKRKREDEFDPDAYYADRRLALCQPATRGIWMDLLCCMYADKPRTGELTGTAPLLAAAYGRCSPEQMQEALMDLQATGAADVTMLQDGRYTVQNRRLRRLHLQGGSSVAEKPAPLTGPRFNRELFDRFWAAFPHKKSKGQAEKAWAKLNPDEALTDTIIEAVEREKEWRADRPMNAFTPQWKYPATWLNARCWEDMMDSDESERPRRRSTLAAMLDDCAGPDEDEG